MPIMNMPESAKNSEYIVARECDGQFWYWGCYKNVSDAFSAAEHVNGSVFMTKEVI